MLNLDYFKDGELGVESVLNRPLKQIVLQVGEFTEGTFLTKGDVVTKDNITKKETEKKIIDWKSIKDIMYASNIYIGKIEMQSIEYSEKSIGLPLGWIPCNGAYYSTTSEIGKALISLSTKYKTQWEIAEVNKTINVPLIKNNSVFVSGIPNESNSFSGSEKTGTIKTFISMQPCIFLGLISQVPTFPEMKDAIYFGWYEDDEALGFDEGVFYEGDNA